MLNAVTLVNVFTRSQVNRYSAHTPKSQELPPHRLHWLRNGPSVGLSFSLNRNTDFALHVEKPSRSPRVRNNHQMAMQIILMKPLHRWGLPCQTWKSQA